MLFHLKDGGWGTVTKLLKFRSLSERDNKPWRFTIGFTLTMSIIKYIDVSFVLKCTCILIIGKSKKVERKIQK